MINNFKKSLKFTAIFGSMQVILVITQVIRSKFIAIKTGPEGFGEYSIYLSIFALILTIAGFGVNQGIVKECASLFEKKEFNLLLKIKNKITQYIILFFVIILLMLAIFLKPIHELFFTSKNNILFTFLVAASVIFSVLANNNIAFFQISKKFSVVYKVKVYSAIASLIVTLLLIYFLGSDGFVFAIISASVIYFIFSLKKKDEIITITNESENNYVKEIFLIGLVFFIGSVIGALVININNYIVLNYSNYEITGFWNAGRTIIINYSGLIFVGLSLEFYPRLASAKDSIYEMANILNNQVKVLLLFVIPITIGLIIFSNVILLLLFSNKFLVVVPFLKLSAISILINTFTFALSYYPLVRGNKISYLLINSVAPGIFSIILSYYFFLNYSLIGMGYAILIVSCIHFLSLLCYNYKKYNYFPSLNLIKIFTYGIFIILAVFFIEYLNLQLYIKWAIEILILIFASFLSFFRLFKNAE